jgi:hypothetical protein
MPFILYINHLIFIVEDWMQIVEGIPNATAVQLDVMDCGSLDKYISQVDSFLWYIYLRLPELML